MYTFKECEGVIYSKGGSYLFNEVLPFSAGFSCGIFEFINDVCVGYYSKASIFSGSEVKLYLMQYFAERLALVDKGY